MKYLMWREALLLFVFWICGFLTSVSAFLIFIDGDSFYIWAFIICFLLWIVSLICMGKLGLSLSEFLSVLENNGFKMIQKKRLMLLGMTSNGIIIKGFFYGRCSMMLFNEDLFSEAAISSNLRFYFPCSTPGILNHYIIKYGTNFKAGLNQLWRGNGACLTLSESEFYHILFNICADIDFLAINHLSSGPGYICIATGPLGLLYGKHAERNIRGILKFIEAYRNYFNCQDVKWGANINLNNLNENIQVIENNCKSF